MRLTRSLLLASGLIALLAPLQVLAQEPYDIVKSEKAESFTLPYTAANVERGDPLVYTYDEPKGQNWILTLDDRLEYVDRNDSKIVVTVTISSYTHPPTSFSYITW